MEPERQIEKLLRAVAKKHHDQAGDPVELHPVARQELLREVSRRSEQTSGGLFSNFFSALRPRLALAACFLAILVIAGWLALPLLTEKHNASPIAGAQSDLEFAKNSAPAATPAPATPPMAMPGANQNSATPELQAARPNDLAADRKTVNVDSAKEVNGPKGGTTRDKVFSANIAGSAQPSISSPAAPPGGSTGVFKNPPQAAPAATLGAAPPVTVAAAEPPAQKSLNAQSATDTLQVGGQAEFDMANKDRAATRITPVSQRFYRVAVAPAPAVNRSGFGGGGAGGVSGVAPVLASFQVEQHGPQIRIIDADGSVYTGRWQTTPFDRTPTAGTPATYAAPGAASLHNSVAAVRAPKKETPAPPAQYYFFRVSGTNRNLKQNIVFSGSFIPLTNVLNGSISGSVEARRAESTTATSPMLSNSRIAGKVVIGNKREIELNASPTRK